VLEILYALKPVCAVASVVCAVIFVMLSIRYMDLTFNPIRLFISVGAVVTCLEVFVLCAPINWFI
jgi:hypothetical protein